MTNWKPMSAVRSLRPETDPLKEPFSTNYNRKNEMCRVGKRNAMVLVENEM